MSEHIGIHVVGSGFGESVVIEFPDGTAGVIDPFCQDITVDGSNCSEKHPIARFLDRDVKPSALRFVSITHPHIDHCLGVSGFLEYYDRAIEKLWLYEGFQLDTAERYLAKLLDGKARESTEEPLLLPPGTLLHELEAMNRWRRKNPDRFDKWRHNTYVDLQFTTGNTREARLLFLAPTKGILRRLDDGLEDAIRSIRASPTGEAYLNTAHIAAIESKINSLSIVFVLSWGNLLLLFCGDAERETWEGVFKVDCSAPLLQKLRANWVKVGHHGSSNGYSAALLSALRESRPACVLTPFNRISLARRLPSRTALEELHGCSSAIHTTCTRFSSHAGTWRAASKPAAQGEDSSTQTVPARWAPLLQANPHLAQALVYVKRPTGEEKGTPDVPAFMYADMKANPELVRLFRPEYREHILTALAGMEEPVVGTKEPVVEQNFRTSHYYGVDGKLLDIYVGEGAGSYSPD